VRRFKTFTTDLHRLADWLAACQIETIAMEATGVYWIPVYEILEERGFEVILVNARHVKNVPGRKTDVVDCQWIQELHSFGLLRGSFRPSAEIATLRAYLRHREKMLRNAGDHVRRMQKTLAQMNLQLHNVISDITGETGMRILRDIVSGVTDPKVLAAHRHSRCRANEQEIEASLTGNYRREHVFALRQHLNLYDAYQQQITMCDAEIESLLQEMASRQGDPKAPLPHRRSRSPRSDNAPRFEIRALLHRLTGSDLTQIDSLGPYSALRLVSEIGTDMRRWPTEKHFTSWLTLAPKNKISGGKILSSKTQPSSNRAAATLRMCAMSVGRTSTALGAYYRRLAYRVGKAKAITATARKIAILVYRVLRGDLDYNDPGAQAQAYEAQHRSRVLRNLLKRAKDLGFDLVNLETGELLPGTVS
jgi:transposase